MSQFATIEKDGLQIITCPPSLDMEIVPPVETQVKGWLLSPAKTHVLDFKDVAFVKPTAYRAFVLYNQALKANGKRLFVVNVQAKILNQFKADGLTSVFVAVASLDEVKRRSQPARAMVDVEFLNPFIAAAQNVLETQAGLTISAGKPTMKKPDEEIPMQIAGVLSLNCKEFVGSINLCFCTEVFLKVYEGLTGEKHEVINDEIKDAGAEILNMIFGQAKTVLNDQRGFALDRALPSVLTGEKLRLHHTGRSPAIVIPFESSAGTFHLEILVDRV